MSKIQLNVIETSDVHGHIMPHRYRTESDLPLGLAKIGSLIREERTKHDHVLLIDNGDLIQGTPLTTYFSKLDTEQEHPLIRAANLLDYDASVLGNHEFNFGLNTLNKAVKDSSFPWLAANIVNRETKQCYFGRPYIVKEFEGVKVAILGLTTQYIPNWEDPHHIEGLEFEDCVESAKKWVKQIRETEEPDVMIVSYHGGFERNPENGAEEERETGENQGYAICQEVEGIDLLLTGHQHRLLAGKCGDVHILQPGCFGAVVGKAVIELEKRSEKWSITSIHTELIEPINVEADQAVVDASNALEEEVQAWLDEPIGHVEGSLRIEDAFDVRLNKHPFTEFINKVQMEASKTAISSTALFDNTSKGFPDTITIRDVMSNYIYPNTLKVLEITGEELKAALERSASYFQVVDGKPDINPAFLYPKPQHYNYDMWEGIRYTIDLSKNEGERIVQLEEENGKAINMQETYEVVMSNYRASGGGEYTMFKDKPVIREMQDDMTDLIIQYVQKHKTISSTVNQNWRVIW
ncbi:bifunctional metallophosphatase/5'-nucleotidase [Alkalicoccobacillus murimartini]|uniref:2',3'-cyclic-nucleotide 2'-phosphodiesterase/3'-nucleotidase n=1 Tax=Alkalicoccobacillus murimartini TaxID=171685 RepID=A0ABT9YDU7_9BACI|nr:bifunctional UDP-sugar hydrolase/5'-nucleotidase [Alkalicoccobacillus murimartini]MDQ0206015.1 2',3'-cyclic-nucleotide 2'-phosphodiesterase/3'-nucleotidase [Alkalicoccobacillus murimartini]